MDSVVYVTYHIDYGILLNEYNFVKATQYHNVCILYYILFLFQIFQNKSQIFSPSVSVLSKIIIIIITICINRSTGNISY